MSLVTNAIRLRRPPSQPFMRMTAWPRMTAALAALLVVAGCGGGEGPSAPNTSEPADGPGLHQLTLDSGGEQRDYLLDVPDGSHPDEPVPLIVVLHAGDSDAGTIRRNSQMERLANEHGVLVAYPQAVDAEGGRFWRPVLEGEHGVGVALGGDPVDVEFLRHLVEHLVERWNAAPDRVYAAGHSNGAAMAYRLAAEAGDLFAAVAPVGGYVFEPPTTLEPAEPVSVMGFVGLAAEAEPEISQGLDIWRDRLGCDPGDPGYLDDHRQVTRIVAQCRDGSEVVEFRIEGMRHVWPRRSTHGIEATDVIWEFFIAHAR